MGHKISKEQIDPSVKDYIMSFVGDVDDLETEVKSDIISAVNSLIVDRVVNIENMGKLAEAIGEPVTASDSVDEVVEKVDELVANFKSKVLNAGIMYDSEDRFKQLIEKLEGLVAGEGKGIQISTGHFDITTLQPASEGNGVLTSNQLNFNPPLNFTPDRVILSIPKLQLGTSVVGDYAHHSIDSEIHSAANHRFTVYDKNGNEINMYISTVIDDITAEGFVLNAGKITTDYDLTTPEGIDWLAIGVGEEDTTLRDSLASILQEEGVDVTEEDDMASLITKVDQEFDKYNKGYYSFISGDDITLFSKSTSYTYGGLSTNKTWDLCERYDCIFNGTVKITLQNVETNFHYYTIYQYNSKGNLINTITSTNYEYSTSEFINDINVSEGDYINAIITYTNGSGQGRTYCDIKCSLK